MSIYLSYLFIIILYLFIVNIFLNYISIVTILMIACMGMFLQ